MGCAGSVPRRPQKMYRDNGSTSPTDEDEALYHEGLEECRSETSKGTIVSEPGAIASFAKLQAKIIHARLMHGITSDPDQFKDDDHLSQTKLVKVQLRIRRWLSRTTLPLPGSALEVDVSDQSAGTGTAMYSSMGLASQPDNNEEAEEATTPDVEDQAVAPPMVEPTSDQPAEAMPGYVQDTTSPSPNDDKGCHAATPPLMMNDPMLRCAVPAMSGRARGTLLLGRQRVIHHYQPQYNDATPKAAPSCGSAESKMKTEHVFLSAEALALHVRLVRGV